MTALERQHLVSNATARGRLKDGLLAAAAFFITSFPTAADPISNAALYTRRLRLANAIHEATEHWLNILWPRTLSYLYTLPDQTITAHSLKRLAKPDPGALLPDGSPDPDALTAAQESALTTFATDAFKAVFDTALDMAEKH